MKEINNITNEEFIEIINNKSDVQIIDVRINPDIPLGFKCSIHIPLNKLNNSIEKINREKKVVFICDNGVNSFFAIQVLQSCHKFTNLWNLKGGISNL